MKAGLRLISLSWRESFASKLHSKRRYESYSTGIDLYCSSPGQRQIVHRRLLSDEAIISMMEGSTSLGWWSMQTNAVTVLRFAQVPFWAYKADTMTPSEVDSAIPWEQYPQDLTSAKTCFYNLYSYTRKSKSPRVPRDRLLSLSSKSLPQQRRSYHQLELQCRPSLMWRVELHSNQRLTFKPYLSIPNYTLVWLRVPSSLQALFTKSTKTKA